MLKPRKQISAKRKKTSSAKSQRKSAVLSALASLEPFSGQALVAAAQEGLQALKEKRTLRTFRVNSPCTTETQGDRRHPFFTECKPGGLRLLSWGQ
jgi:hypothetical protein